MDTATHNLPPILSEELEHFDDNWLDARYENLLAASGDKLYPLKEIGAIVKILLSQELTKPQNQSTSEQLSETGGNFSVGYNGAAVAVAREAVASIMPNSEADADSELMPDLPENPTEQEIWQFAENHPLTKKIRKIFGAKIVAVERK